MQTFKHQQNLIGLFAQHKVAANLLMLMMIMGGGWALSKLNTQFLPNFALDVITVTVLWTGAAAEDVVGAVDIGASLQFSLAQPAGAAVSGGAALQGDVVEIGEPSDLLEINERMGNVRETLTDAFLDALRSGLVTTDEGTTDYNQYLRFESTSNDNNITNTPALNFTENDAPTSEVGDYLYIAEGSSPNTTFFEYELEFFRTGLDEFRKPKRIAVKRRMSSG